MSTTDLKGYPLSLQQARLWALQGESSAYHAQCAICMEGPLKLETFEQAVQWVVNRHSILRTSFYHLSGMDLPVQVVKSQVEVGCVVVDLEHLSEEMQEFQIKACFDLTRCEGFDSAKSSLLVTKLFRLSSERHLLLIALPALCADGYTLTQMLAELSQAYSSDLQARDQDEEPLQYADVAAWQDELLHAEEAEALRQYWCNVDLSRLLTQRLPFERPPFASGPAQEFVPIMLEIPLEESLSIQTSRLARELGVSIETWLLACWEVVLWRCRDHWTYPDGKQDLVIGVACDGRVYEEQANALGLYTRFVPIETCLKDAMSFKQVVTSVHDALFAATKRQIYFTWEEVSTSDAMASDSAPLFFPICFELERWPSLYVDGELNLSLHRRFYCTERFALKLSVLQVGERLHLEVYADPQRIGLAQIRQFARILQILIRGVVEQPLAKVRMLPLLEPDERASLLTLGRAPVGKRKQTSSFHRLFEEQARRQPNQLAVICSGVVYPAVRELTYQQLNERANRLAWVLRKRGVGPNMLVPMASNPVVGLCMTRGVQALVGLLGILKAGGAYLPLDPASPPARLIHQLQESQALLLLTESEVQPVLPAWRGGSTLCLEDLEQELSEAQVNALPGSCEEEALAYVISTSGSTGVPKGVMIRHKSLVNYTRALCELLGSEPGWQYATVSTLSADLGNTAIFCALASGGCVQVLDAEMVIDASAMIKWVEQHPIDVLKIVPSHLSALLVGEHVKTLIPRQALVLGGEALEVGLLERLEELGGDCKVFNHYGPTETTIGVLVNPLGVLRTSLSLFERYGEWEPIPLGRAINSVEVYVLDNWMQLVPIGVTGELYIGGTCLAMGYVGQAEQTAERFVPHPFSFVGTGARLYRTGDLARYDEEGNIEFVGRGDSQVKLRGYRIELGEIETVLGQHEAIEVCIALIREYEAGDKRLVAYLVSKPGQMIAARDLRSYLQDRLPSYMIPQAFVFLDALPLTPSGKVDRVALGQAQGTVPTVPMEHTEEKGAEDARNPIEELLVGLWEEVLGRRQVNTRQNFFELGGHSLLATRLIAKVKATLRIDVPLRALFEASTVAEFAQQVEQALREGEGVHIPPLVAMPRPEQIPLSFAQQRLWFVDQLQPGRTEYLVPLVHHLPGSVNTEVLERSLSEMIHRHESLRTTFTAEAGQPMQIIHPAGCYCLPIIDLRELTPERKKREAWQLAKQEAHHPCDLEKGPLLRTSLLRLDHDEHVLLLTFHHIITDGWSNNVLRRELVTLYQAHVSRQPSPLAPLPLQYADYALRQRGFLQGEVLEAKLDYWTQRLAGAPPIELPTDYSRPSVGTGLAAVRGATHHFVLSQDLTQALHVLSREAGVTLFMVLLAAFKVLFYRSTGQADIVVGTDSANRQQVETEGIIGFFINLLALRTNLSGKPTFQEVLKRVREVVLGAYTHQDMPFELLVEKLAPEHYLDRTPLIQALFVLQNIPAEPEKEEDTVPHVERETVDQSFLRPREAEETLVKFDLAVFLWEHEGSLFGAWNYRLDLFKASTIAALVARFEALLQSSVNEPDLSIDLLSLTPDAERAQQEQKQGESKRGLPMPDDGWFEFPNIDLNSDFTQDTRRK